MSLRGARIRSERTLGALRQTRESLIAHGLVGESVSVVLEKRSVDLDDLEVRRAAARVGERQGLIVRAARVHPRVERSRRRRQVARLQDEILPLARVGNDELAVLIRSVVGQRRLEVLAAAGREQNVEAVVLRVVAGGRKGLRLGTGAEVLDRRAVQTGVVVAVSDVADHQAARSRDAARLADEDVVDLPPPAEERVEVEADLHVLRARRVERQDDDLRPAVAAARLLEDVGPVRPAVGRVVDVDDRARSNPRSRN